MISNFKKNLKNSIKYILGQKVLIILCNLLMFLVLGLILDPETYGIYSLHYAYALLGFAIVSGGLDELILKILLDDNPPTLFEMILLKFIYFLLFIIISFLFFSSLSEIYLYLGAVFFSIFIVSHANFEVKAKGKQLSIYVLTCTIFFLVSKLIFINFFENKVRFLGFFLCLENFFLSFIPFLFQIKNKEMKLRVGLMKKIFKTCIPLWLSSVIFILSARVDYYLINKNFDFFTLGKYSLISRMVEQSYILPNVLLASLMVMLVYNNNNGERNELKIYKIAFYGGFLLSIFVFCFCIFILRYKGILDINWLVASLILCLCIPFASLRVANSKYMIIDEKQNLYLKRTCLTFLFSICSTTLLIKFYGIIGLCLAVLLTIIFSSLFFDLLSNETRNYFFIKIKAIGLREN